MNSISDKISSFPEEFINELVQYCLDCGTGIEYTETNSDGSKNLTTDAERLKPAAYNGKVRYIRPETINWFISDDVLLKTKYILRLARLLDIDVKNPPDCPVRSREFINGCFDFKIAIFTTALVCGNRSMCLIVL